MALVEMNVRAREPEPTSAPTQSAAGPAWSTDVEVVMRSTVEQLRASAIGDQQAFERLVSAGIPEQQARAILSTFLATSSI